MQRRDFLMGLGATLLLFGENTLAGCAAQTTVNGQANKEPMDKPIYEAQIQDEDDLNEQCAPFLALSPEALAATVPPQSGFLYSGCPNCQGGTGDDNLAWDLSLGEKVQCKYCKIVLPNEQYPENKSVEFPTPTGQTQTFRFHQKDSGRKYWFEGRRWFDQRATLEKAAYSLAQLYRLNPEKYREAGIRCVAILRQFTALYPSYIIKYEYPGTDKIFVPAGQSIKDFPGLGVGASYAAKFSAWGYMDLSVPLLLAYDQLAGSDLLDAATRKDLETTLFGGMVDFVAKHDALPINNMSPTLWRSQAIATNVLRRPEIAAAILPGIRYMLNTDFTYDSFWREGTVSYHQQTAGGFQNVFEALYPRKEGEPPEALFRRLPPEVSQAMSVMANFYLPNGHYAALNDTWGDEIYRGTVLKKSSPHLMPGLGYAILGAGQLKQQMQAHLKFTGRYGHHHYDSLNLLFFAREKELVSDIGYTHNKARPWASSTAGHSTVLVNQQNQVGGVEPRNGLGNLLLFNADDENFQAVEASALEAYPDLVSDYRRTLIMVQAPGQVQYTIDIFHVTGGERHDWILHGSVDDEQQLELTDSDDKKLTLADSDSFLPAGFVFQPARSEGDHEFVFNGPWAYGNFRDILKTSSEADVKSTFRFKEQPTRGLQSWIVGAPNSVYFTTRSWAVRGIKDQAKLDERLRTSMIVRRNGSSNRFVAVHVPFENASPVQKIVALPWPDGGVALKIEHTGGTDFVLYQNDARQRSGQLDGKSVTFDGRIALIRSEGRQIQLKMIGGSLLQYADKKLANLSSSARLIGVKDNRLIVEGGFKASPGEVIIVQHGEGKTSGFHVAQITAEGANTGIRTREPAVFSMASNDTLKMRFFPHLELPGPHRVISHGFATT